MKDHTENRGKYPGLSQLSTPELEELLRREFAASGEDGPDLEARMAIMEVITSREEDDIPEADVDAAWAAFRENVIEATSTETSLEETVAEPVVIPFEKSEKTRKPKRFRWAVSAAAVVCLLVGVMTTPALGNGLIESLISWTEETFFFGNGKDTDSSLNDVMYEQLEENVAKLTDLPVLPTWYPEGTTVERVEETDLINGKSVDILCSKGENTFTMSVSVYASVPEMNTGKYEKNDGIVEPYYSNRIAHYIVGNETSHTAAWQNENVECFIQGELTVEELKMMIDSIYT